jgi:aspartate-semialdehyde dehydrogenase
MSRRVAVFGATGAVGKEILTLLDKAPWRPESVSAFASARSEVPSVEFGEKSVLVEDADDANFEGFDAVFLATPRSVSRELGERAVADGALVIDLSGVFSGDGDVPVVAPWVNPEALASSSLRGIVQVPSGPALLVASVLGPLQRAGVYASASATVLVPASAEGRGGIDELSRQVVALFNQSPPPRKVFEHGLAFDLLPQLGDVDADGWTESEARAMREVASVIGARAPSITLVGTPVFSGISATIQIRLSEPATGDRLLRVLSDGGVQLPKQAGARGLPRPRKVEGHPFAHVARLRPDPNGDGLHLWAACDNLRTAAAAAVGAAGALLRARQ